MGRTACTEPEFLYKGAPFTVPYVLDCGVKMLFCRINFEGTSIIITIIIILDFKLSPCYECCMLSSGYFPDV